MIVVASFLLLVLNAAIWRSVLLGQRATSILSRHKQGQQLGQGQEQGTKGDMRQAMPPPTGLSPTARVQGEQGRAQDCN